MTVPPPGPFGQQPPHGGPGGGSPESWPQYPGGPTPPPPAGPPPPWGPQQHWPNGPTPPNRGGGGKAKWILGGVAVVLAIALAVVVTVLVVRPDKGTEPPADGNHGSESKFASAGDLGPVTIITDDPTCNAWGSISRELAAAEESVEWANRDYTKPATSWTPSERQMYESVGKAMSTAAENTAKLSGQTPHRVMRELYDQFIAYATLFAKRVPSYDVKDDDFAAVADGISSALGRICTAVALNAASAVGPLLSEPEGPSAELRLSTDDSTQRFIENENAVCDDWESNAKQFAARVESWQAMDPNIPSTDWTSEQRSVVDDVRPVMSANADELERLGRQSHNPTFEDFAILAAQYRRAFVTALPSYTPADSSLSATSTYLVNSVLWACKAAS